LELINTVFGTYTRVGPNVSGLTYCCIHQRSDADRTYLRCCPVRAWTRLRFLEGARDRRWLWSETSTHFHW